jgi:HSP20 family protein
MATRSPRSWMWAEAWEMLDQAQKLQRQFFRYGEAVRQRPRWEPPVDIVAYDPEIEVTVALPGVCAAEIDVGITDGALTVGAERAFPLGRHATGLHRLEIPYGRFERRIELPAGRYRLLEQSCVNGCLILRLARL